MVLCGFVISFVGLLGLAGFGFGVRGGFSGFEIFDFVFCFADFVLGLARVTVDLLCFRWFCGFWYIVLVISFIDVSKLLALGLV